MSPFVPVCWFVVLLSGCCRADTAEDVLLSDVFAKAFIASLFSEIL